MDALEEPLPLAEIEQFLTELHGCQVSHVEPLKGGFWSSAYAYRAGEDALVLRLGTVREGFEADRAAMAFDGPDLPVPPVRAIGDAFGRAYAISERRYGRFLETVTPDQAPVAGPTLMRLLGALRRAPETGAQSAGATPWRQWLQDSLVDDPTQLVSGWRPLLSADTKIDGLFRACERAIGDLAGECPERRDLVHGDLLHANVLVAEDASRVNAVFSWKCSMRGDFLYDVAWCTFWAGWHPGIDAIDVWGRALRDRTLTGEDLAAASARHHCYELQIGATHLAWNAWTADADGLRAVAAHTEALLERGPRPAPAG